MTWRVGVTFALLCVIWGVPYFFIKLALADLSPACIAWGRIAVAAVILTPIAWRRGVLKPALAHKSAIAAFAVVEMVGPFVLIALGEQWVSSSFAGILVATVPLVVLLLAPLFGVRERLSTTRAIGLAIGFIGVAALLGLDTGHDARLWWGVLALLIAVVGYAIGPLIIERHLHDVDHLGSLAASLIVATALLGPFAIATAPSHLPSTLSLVSVAALGLFCTAIAMLLYFWLVAHTGAARAAVVAYVNPAVAALLGVFILNEPFGIGSIVGLAMILFGSWLATSKREAVGG